MHGAAHHRRGFDLHLGALATDDESADRARALRGRRTHLQPQRRRRHPPGDTLQCLGDLRRIRVEILRRQPREVDIDRQARQIVFEQIDGGAALQRGTRLAVELREDGDEQGDPVGVAPIQAVLRDPLAA